jgi:protein-disulfide isomerase
LETEEPTKGYADAPVVIEEFSDFRCGHCANFALFTLPEFREYLHQGKVKIVFRNFPVLGPQSQLAAQAGECAHQQGRFWEYHDKLFKATYNRENIFTKEGLKEVAAELDLDTEAFNLCLEEGKYVDEVEQDTSDGRQLGVQGTPTFFINGRMLVGNQPFSKFQRIIEEELQKE